MEWNAQNKDLKKNLVDHMVNLFGDLFNKSEITSRASTYLKYSEINIGFN
jgi:hypothetical protein